MDPDVRDGRPRGDVPVDPADVVARLVRADLGELGAAAQVVGAVLPGDEAPDPAPHRDVEGAEERLGCRPGSRLGLGARSREQRQAHAEMLAAVSCGIGTAGISRSRIMSAVTSSDRALKLGTIRCRSTSRARSATSDGMT